MGGGAVDFDIRLNFDMAINAIHILSHLKSKVTLILSDDRVPVLIFSQVNTGLQKYTQVGTRNQ